MGLEPEREEGFLDLAVERALVGEEEVLGELLGQRRAALDDAAGTGILGDGTEEAEEIDAEMLEEAAVLGGEEGGDDEGRQLLIADQDAAALPDFFDQAAVAPAQLSRRVPVAAALVEE